jgi:nucleoside recognition membrane protein YjiH
MQNIVINNQQVSLQAVINDVATSIENGFKGIGNFTPEVVMELAKMVGFSSDEAVKAPKDYLEPQWNAKNRIYEWKNYIPKEQQVIWNTFSDRQKAVLAKEADKKAMMESWD